MQGMLGLLRSYLGESLKYMAQNNQIIAISIYCFILRENLYCDEGHIETFLVPFNFFSIQIVNHGNTHSGKRRPMCEMLELIL